MRFIDGHIVMERLQELTEVITNHVMVAGLLIAQGAVLETPTIDAVEVVRCKDCKHRYEAECPMYFEEQIDIDEGDGYYDTEYIVHDYTRDDGFCSWGERRTND